jgi:hypothetical protein
MAGDLGGHGMSVLNHPNIQAAGLVTDIFEAFRKRLRGKAVVSEQAVKKSNELLQLHIVKFVNELSTGLDKEFGDHVSTD